MADSRKSAQIAPPDGFPLAYEVMPGNTSDRETQMPFIRRLEGKYGKLGSLWLMDRGVPTEKTLAAMRESGYRYLVGAPRGHLKVLGDKLKKSDWQNVQEGVDVKMAKAGGSWRMISNPQGRQEGLSRDVQVEARLGAHPRGPRE